MNFPQTTYNEIPEYPIIDIDWDDDDFDYEYDYEDEDDYPFTDEEESGDIRW